MKVVKTITSFLLYFFDFKIVSHKLTLFIIIVTDLIFLFNLININSISIDSKSV